MNARSFERKVTGLIAEVNALLPQLEANERQAISDGLATLQAFAMRLPKEKSATAKRILDDVQVLVKTVLLAHAPLVGLGDEADEVVPRVINAALAAAGNIKAAVGPLAPGAALPPVNP